MLLPILLALTAAHPHPALSAEPSRFFANEEVQAQAPLAFALSAESLPALEELENSAPAEALAVANAVKADRALYERVRGFAYLGDEAREQTLRALFAVETTTLGITPPELVLGEGVTPGAAFFDFEVEGSAPGRVLLNTAELAKLEPAASLSLLLHETRHSAQLQRARKPTTPLARGLLASFRAQKELRIRSFCDFLTLLNEHEAFRFGNQVLGLLTGFENRQKDMGTYASQFDEKGALKLDLLALHRAGGNVLGRFNELEKAQLIELGGKP